MERTIHGVGGVYARPRPRVPTPTVGTIKLSSNKIIRFMSVLVYSKSGTHKPTIRTAHERAIL